MLSVKYFGHSCFKISNGITSVVFDPYQDNSVPNLKLPHIRSSYVLSSHDHNDHNALRLIDEEEQIYEMLDKKIIPSFHDHHKGTHRGMNTIHIINLSGYRICHLGDIGDISDEELISQLQEIDIMFVPINGHYTISSFEAYELYKLTKPKLFIPMHYFMKEFSSGYPDGGQIDQFRELFPKAIEVNDSKIEIDDALLNNNILIFNKYQTEDDL